MKINNMRFTLAMAAAMLFQTTSAQIGEHAKMETYPIHVGWDKTTVLLFPNAISSADFGIPALIAQKDEAAPNVLKLKAGERFFPSTSMYVITNDGKLYPFTVSYTEYPDVRPIDMGRQEDLGNSEALLGGLSLGPSGLNRVIEELSHNAKGVKTWGKSSGKLRLGKGTLWEKDGILFFQIVVENSSGVDFLPDHWKFTIQDKNVAKRTAIRQISLEPVSESFYGSVQRRSASLAVFAFRSFTISDAKEFRFQVFEKNGDRNPVLKFSGKELLKAGSTDSNELNNTNQ